MEDWARWNRGYKMKLGYPSFSSGLSCGRASQNFDDMIEVEDRKAFTIIDAIISDLPQVQAAAVRRRYGISVVFGFSREVYERGLCDAHEKLMTELRRHGVLA